MAEIVLDQAQVVAAIGKIVATGVAQRVSVDVAETGTPGGGGDEIVSRLTGEGLVALGQEGSVGKKGRGTTLARLMFALVDHAARGSGTDGANSSRRSFRSRSGPSGASPLQV